MKLSELRFEGWERQRLLQHYIREISTVEEFLELSLLEVKRIGCLGASEDAVDFRAEVAQQFLSRSFGSDVAAAGAQDFTITAQALRDLEAATGIRPMTSGCKTIDAALPIFVPGHVVEIAGESGCGKTQLCMQLCITVQLPTEFGGLGGRAMYVLSESGSLPTSRLQEIAEGMERRMPGALPPNPLDGVLVLSLMRCSSDRYAEQFRECERRCEKEGIKLLVVDSAAGMFRGRDEMEDPIHRAESIWSIAEVLHSIAAKGIVVVLANQVTSVIDKLPGSGSGGGVSGMLNRVAPALGPTWSNTVNTRVLVTQTPIKHDGTKVMLMQLLFSPTLPLPTASSFYEINDGGNHEKGAVLYHIDKDGVHGI